MVVTAAVDYYRVLQVDPDAEPEVIVAAYRKLAAKYHPDVNGSPEAETRMRGINVAYSILGDAEQRAAYDQARGSRWGPSSNTPTAATPRPASPRSMVEQLGRTIAIMLAWSLAFTYLGNTFGGRGGMAVALLLVLAIVLWKGSAIMKFLGRGR